MSANTNTTAMATSRTLWERITAPVRVAAFTAEVAVTSVATATVVVDHAVQAGSLWAHQQLIEAEASINASPEAVRWANIARNI